MSSVRLGLRDWGRAELLAGLRAWFGLFRRDEVGDSVERWFATHFGRPAFALESGTCALRISLACLKSESPGRTEVILPGLACPAVTRAVLAEGLRPIYADIGPDLNSPLEAISAIVSDASLAVVMVHSYGKPADVVGIARLCREHGVGLIDDAAQRVDPKAGLGTSGDFGIFSFAQSKSVVTGIDGSGGVLLVNEPRRLERVRRRVGRLGVATGRRTAWLEFLMISAAPRLSYYLARWRARRNAHERACARIAAIDAAIALVQLGSLDTRFAARREQLAWYQRGLKGIGVAAPQLPSDAAPEYLARLLVALPDGSRDDCRRALAAQGVMTRLPYALPASLDAGSCENARAISGRLLELPLPADLSPADVERICAILHRCVNAHAATLGADFGPGSTEKAERACSTTGN